MLFHISTKCRCYTISAKQEYKEPKFISASLIKLKSIPFCMCTSFWINIQKLLPRFFTGTATWERRHVWHRASASWCQERLSRTTSCLRTHYICRHLVSSNHDKCINIRTTALPKNTASRNSDGWHLCRQDFIQLLWLALLSQRKKQMASFFFFHFDAETSACFIKGKKMLSRWFWTIVTSFFNFCSCCGLMFQNNLQAFNESTSLTLYSTKLDKSQQDQTMRHYTHQPLN